MQDSSAQGTSVREAREIRSYPYAGGPRCLIQLNERRGRPAQHSNHLPEEGEIMEMRTILAAVSGGSASAGVIELACRLARDFGSHVEAFHARLDPREMMFVAADGFSTPLTGDLIDLAMRDAAETATKAHALFDAAAARHGLPLVDEPSVQSAATACWREEQGYGAVKLAERARFFDLVVLGRSGRVIDEPHSDAIEEALLTSGRPVLVAPAEPPAKLGERVALAWNDSPESAHALAASLPLLRRAKTVDVLGLGETGAAALARHLGWYGIAAAAVAVPAVEHVGAGELLLAAARDQGADLLVMGGYGKSPLREMLFGGATRQVVGTSLLPLLLSH